MLPNEYICWNWVDALAQTEMKKMKRIIIIADEPEIRGSIHINLIFGLLSNPQKWYLLESFHLQKSIDANTTLRLVYDAIKFFHISWEQMLHVMWWKALIRLIAPWKFVFSRQGKEFDSDCHCPNCKKYIQSICIWFHWTTTSLGNWLTCLLYTSPSPRD